jgi:uncharacterized protein (TIGR03067 family)
MRRFNLGMMCCLATLLAGGCNPAVNRSNKEQSAAVPPKNDLQTIQGAWLMTIDDDPPIRVVFKNDKVRIGENVEELTVTLDAARQPAWIDIARQLEGGRSSVAHGIYQLDGDNLKICLNDSEADDRPTKFENDRERRHSLRTCKRPTTDLDKMQGHWEPAAAGEENKRSGAYVIFMKDKMLIGAGRGVPALITVTLDSSKQPRWIDLAWMTGGGNPKVDRVTPGIYELNGDDLRICWSREKQERPTEFVTEADQDHGLLIVKRR